MKRRPTVSQKQKKENTSFHLLVTEPAAGNESKNSLIGSGKGNAGKTATVVLKDGEVRK
jgi:hypothetical protein